MGPGGTSPIAGSGKAESFRVQMDLGLCMFNSLTHAHGPAGRPGIHSPSQFPHSRAAPNLPARDRILLSLNKGWTQVGVKRPTMEYTQELVESHRPRPHPGTRYRSNGLAGV